MSKTLSLVSVSTTLEAAYAELTGRLAHLEGQLTAAAAVIAELRAQLKQQEAAGGALPAEQQQAADDLPPAWWQLAGLERFAPPAQEKVEVIASYGFMGNAAEPPNPYAQLIRSRGHGGRALAILKPDVAARMHAAGRFALPPGVKHVCFTR